MLSNHGHVKKGSRKAKITQENQLEPDTVIRPLKDDDFEHIMNIENACFPGHLAYSRQQMNYLLFKANSTTLVEVSGDKITGYVTALFRKNSRIAGIETIGVAPHAQGRGAGKRLLNAAEKNMLDRGTEACRLEVSSGNKAAIAMYRKSGYEVSHVLPDYYIYDHHGTREALRMQKPLTR